MKLGARIFKTGLAIVIAIYIATWAGIEPTFFAAISATFAIQPSVFRSYQTILEQIQANIIGAGLAIIFALTFGFEPVIIGVTVMVTIAIILKIKLDASSIPIALVTVIIIMGNPASQTNFLIFAGERFLLILIGVLSAFLVNLIFLPPKYETKLYHKISDHTVDIIRWIRLKTRFETNHYSLKKDLPVMNETSLKIDNLFALYKEERTYLLKNKWSKARKIVLFKEMISAHRKALSILKALDKHEHQLQGMPEDMQTFIQRQLDHLTEYHDRILMRYVGKVNVQLTDRMEEEVESGENRLTDSFMDLYDQQYVTRDEWLHLLPVVSHIVEYNEQLDHLATLVESFFNFHQKENTVAIKDPEE